MDKPKPTRPTHYKVLCISMYRRDIEEVDARVDELKRRGWSKANRSMLIRLALAQLDVTKLPIPRFEDASPTPAASAAPSASPPEPVESPTTSTPRQSRMRLRKLTSFEIDLAAKHPALASLLAPQ